MDTSLLTTIIVSDMHLSDAEPFNPKKPLWKKFKSQQFFIDLDFKNFLDTLLKEVKTPMELVLNGDTFDFDSTMTIPTNPTDLERMNIVEYERKFGLNPSEEKSTFKMHVIMTQHKVFAEAIANFIRKGNKLILVIGNHDVELNWIKVQKKFKEHLHLTPEEEKRVVFCEWYYVSNKDTLIEHGHQHDPYCLALDPVNPIIKKNGEYRMRLPFGNLANRFMINVMGFKNPHNDESYVKSFSEFISFFLKYELKNQPLIVMDWLFGALKTLIYSVGESFLPAVKDPMTYNSKLKKIAKKSNSTVDVLLALKENHAHPAVRKPLSVIRELWLDRAFLMIALIILSWQFFSIIAVFISISFNWFFLPLSIFMLLFGYYAHGVGSEIKINQSFAEESSIVSAKICGVKMIALGHTHKAFHRVYKKYKIFNSGTWTIYFKDVECKELNYLYSFIMIKPNTEGTERSGKIYEYRDNQIIDYTEKNANIKSV